MRSILLLCCAATLAAQYPEAEISNGVIRAKLHLPDAAKGSYHGTRFDWAGIVYSLEYKGHQYFGKWYKVHDPKIHDAITGPVEEFLTGDSALGYEQAKAGDPFVRIGVGVLRRPADEEKFQRFRTYDIVDGGRWTVRPHRDFIDFTQALTGPYSYLYTKRIRLVKGKPEMIIEHSLKNRGPKPIDTEVYNHNFFVIDNEVVGPDMSIGFGFAPKPAQQLENGGEIRGRELAYTRELQEDQSVFSRMEGFGGSASENQFTIQNRKSGAGVRIKGDLPLSKVVFWSIRTVACPEPYVKLHVAPGQTVKWNIRYEFFTR